MHVHTLAGLLHANFQVPSVGYEDFFRVTRRLTHDQRELVKALKKNNTPAGFALGHASGDAAPPSSLLAVPLGGGAIPAASSSAGQ